MSARGISDLAIALSKIETLFAENKRLRGLFELTDAEARAFDITVDLYNHVIEFPVQHPDDIDEFIAAIHRIQEKLMARPFTRNQHDKV